VLSVKAVEELSRANILTRDKRGPAKVGKYGESGKSGDFGEMLQANKLSSLEGPCKSWQIWRK